MFNGMEIKMKILRCTLQDLKRMVLSPYFFAGIIAFLFLALNGRAIYYDYAGKEYSAFEAFVKLEKSPVYYLSAEYVYMSGTGIWVDEFILIISSFPFISIICDEKESGTKRYFIQKAGILRYCLAKVFSSLLSAGLLCAGGFLLFTVVCHIMFPSIHSMDITQKEMYQGFVTMGYGKLLLRTALNGMEQSLLPLMLCAILSNKYFCTCIPFMVSYGRMALANRIFSNYAFDMTDEQYKILGFLNPGGLSDALLNTENMKLLPGTILLVFFFAVLLTFYFSQKGRRDMGA